MFLRFSVSNFEVLNVASDLRARIVAKKGGDVPVTVVGLKSEHIEGVARSVSYEFAVAFCDLVSNFSDDSIHSEILNHGNNRATRDLQNQKAKNKRTELDKL